MKRSTQTDNRNRAIPKLWFYMGLLVLLFAVVYGAVYQFFYAQTLQKTKENNILTLSILQQTLDAQISFMQGTTQDISQDPDILNAIMGQYPYDDYRTIRKMNSYKRFNPELVDIVILDFYRERAYGSSAIAPIDEYFDRYMRTLYKPTDMVNDIRLCQNDTFYGLADIKPYNATESKEVILYITAISPNRKILFILDQGLFSNPVRFILQENSGLFYVLNPQGKTLLASKIDQRRAQSTDIAFPAHIALEPLDDKMRMGVQDSTLAMLITCEQGNYEYGIVTDANLFQADLGKMQRFFWISLSILLCVGIILSILLANLSYRPVRKLKTFILGHSTAPPLPTGWSDLDLIQDQFSVVLQKLESVNERLQRDRKFLRESLIMGLVSSTSAYENNQELYLREGIFFPYAYLWVIAIATSPEEPDPGVALEHELSSLGILCHFAKLNEYGVMILLINADEENTLDNALHIIHKTYRENGFCCRAGVGEPVNSVALSRLSFMQALTALSKAESIMRYHDMRDAALLHQLTDLTRIKKCLSLSIQKNDMPKVQALLQEAFFTTQDRAQHIFNYSELVTAVMDLANLSHFADGQFGKALYYVFGSREDMISELFYFAGRLADHLEAKRSDPALKLLYETERYLEAHYTNANLSVQDVADAFHVSSSYLNKHLKEVCGETVFSMLDRLRMTQARHLLLTTDLSIREIVQQSGYGDINHFTKKIKKHTGLTPTEYRQVNGVRCEE